MVIAGLHTAAQVRNRSLTADITAQMSVVISMSIHGNRKFVRQDMVTFAAILVRSRSSVTYDSKEIVPECTERAIGAPMAMQSPINDRRCWMWVPLLRRWHVL